MAGHAAGGGGGAWPDMDWEWEGVAVAPHRVAAAQGGGWQWRPPCASFLPPPSDCPTCVCVTHRGAPVPSPRHWPCSWEAVVQCVASFLPTHTPLGPS